MLNYIYIFPNTYVLVTDSSETPSLPKKILKISAFSSFRKNKFILNIKTIENKTPIVTSMYQGIVYPYLEYYMQLCSSFFFLNHTIGEIVEENKQNYQEVSKSNLQAKSRIFGTL